MSLSSNDIVDLIKKNKIDPYKILNIQTDTNDLDIIKKAYKKKAVILHPDKTNGKTETEFVILSICYKYIIYKNSKKNELIQKYYNQYKNKENLNKSDSIRETNDQMKQYYTESNSPNPESDEWLNGNMRKNYFVDDTVISLDEYEKNRKKDKIFMDKYKSSDLLKNKLIDKKGNFNMKKFNEIFDAIKNENTRDLVVRDIKDLEPVHSDNIDMAYIYHSRELETVIANPSKSKKIGNMQEFKQLSINLDENKIDEIMKRKTKDVKIKPMNKKEIKEKISKLKKLDIKKEDMETEDQLFYRKAEKDVKYHDEAEEFIERNMFIFPKQIQNKIRAKINYNQQKFLE